MNWNWTTCSLKGMYYPFLITYAILVIAASTVWISLWEWQEICQGSPWAVFIFPMGLLELARSSVFGKSDWGAILGPLYAAFIFSPILLVPIRGKSERSKAGNLMIFVWKLSYAAYIILTIIIIYIFGKPFEMGEWPTAWKTGEKPVSRSF